VESISKAIVSVDNLSETLDRLPVSFERCVQLVGIVALRSLV
jgi:hypothetical protein